MLLQSSNIIDPDISMPADEKGHLYIVHVHSVLHFVDKEFIRIHGQFAYMSGLLQKLPCSVLRFPLPVFGAYFKYYLKEENVLKVFYYLGFLESYSVELVIGVRSASLSTDF